VLREIVKRLRLDVDFLAWWQQHDDLGMAQRLALFFEELALVNVSTPLVIFVDEIDTTIGLDYADDFFVTIRGLKDGTLVLTLIGHTDRVWSAAFSPDGQLIVNASKDGTVRVWEAHTPPEVENPPDALDALLAQAKQRVTRQLTAEERRRFGLSTDATAVPEPGAQDIAGTPTPTATR